MTVKKKVAASAKSDKNTLLLKRDEAKTEERQLAEVKLSATTLNAATVQNFTKPQIGEVDFMDTLSVMKDSVRKVNAGDLSELEATLTAQAASLNSMFTELARRAVNNMGTYMQSTESYMRLALKAQAQCTRTIEVVAAMKNPPVIFAKQMNVANGHQQINNGSSPNGTHTEKTINLHSELLEVNNGSEKMDTRTTKTTIPKDKAMATMGKIDGS